MRLNFFLMALSAVLVASTAAAPAVPLSHEGDTLFPRSAGAAAAAAMRAPRTNDARTPSVSPSVARQRSGSAQLLSLLGTRAERRSGPKVTRKRQVVQRAPACTRKSSSTTTMASSSTASARASSTAKATTSTKATTSAASSSTAVARKMVSAGYWPEWVAGTLPPENVDWTKFDYLNFAFATANSDGTISFSSGDWSTGLLKRLIASAHKNNKKVVLSIGGWGNSGGFSGAVSDARRATFIKSVQTLRQNFGLDGFDFDWEYPNNVQGGGNNPMDTKNLQTFLVQLRAALPAGQILSAAVPHQPWLSSKGAPVGSVARAASALDYLVIMNYDVWGSSSSPGPNAPLANLCGNSTQPQANAAAGVKQWAAAGMPRSKMLLGIPAYGYLSTSTKNVLRQRDANGAAEETPAWPPVRPEEQRNPFKRAALLKGLSGTTADGQINFSQLVQQGALTAQSDGTFTASNGWTKYWDDCSDTPYLSDGRRVVTYDDTYSLQDKGAFAKEAGIAGVNMWSIDGDVNWKLIKGARTGMGLK